MHNIKSTPNIEPDGQDEEVRADELRRVLREVGVLVHLRQE